MRSLTDRFFKSSEQLLKDRDEEIDTLIRGLSAALEPLGYTVVSHAELTIEDLDILHANLLARHKRYTKDTEELALKEAFKEDTTPEDPHVILGAE